ncbi:MAG: multiheme c-type cytochrome [Pseudomonadota bacterium]
MIGPRLRVLLQGVFVLFALLVVNSVYLAGTSLLEWLSGASWQGAVFQVMFLAHLVLGVVLIAPFLIYAVVHARNAWHRPNRRAVAMGLVLTVAGGVLLITGLVLTRAIPGLPLTSPALRQPLYWVHALVPLLVVWAFVLHRLAGPAIAWRRGAGAFAAALAVTLAVGTWNWWSAPSVGVATADDTDRYHLMPSLAKTADGQPIGVEALVNDQYCVDCHADTHERWAASAHRFASFNNPAYRFSVANTRAEMLARDGNVEGTRFCAGCHDPAPLFSGALEQADFDPDSVAGQAGITCTACHAITSIDSPRGNADYTIGAPRHYPFARSEGGLGKWVNHLLVRANPEFHRRTFLKPLHKTPEFCGTCHKVHLPEAVNDYKWLRGQNHYDTWLLSGVSGHGVSSFYYPPAAKQCNDCHLAPLPSDDFGAVVRAPGEPPTVHDHLMAAANTALGHWLDFPAWSEQATKDMLVGSLRADIFAVREGGDLTGALVAPLRPQVPTLKGGERYLFDVVLRTLTLGHPFTQGTADSNQVWVEVRASLDGVPLAHSGARDPGSGEVDPAAHFVNAFVLDRQGQRIDARNAEDIFTVLYNHQIPPGAADVVHYALALPEGAHGTLTLEVALNYRKFDTRFLALMRDDPEVVNALPITVIARDQLSFPVSVEAGAAQALSAPDIPTWQRWNDYGIGLLRKPGVGELRQAEQAFTMVERQGRGDGSLNLARVYLREGRVDAAADALVRAGGSADVMPWVVAWFNAQVDRQNGYLDEAITQLEAIVDTRFTQARERGFDFASDYRVLNELALTHYERARSLRGERQRDRRGADLEAARRWYTATLELDPENLSAHYGLAQVFAALGKMSEADYHRAQHARYKPDDNAADVAIAAARRAYPQAARAADDTVIYPLVAPRQSRR